MKSYPPEIIATVEASKEDGERDNAKESDRSDDTMASDQGVVLREFSEPVAHACFRLSVFHVITEECNREHTIVAHGVEIQPDEIGQQECVSLRIPRAIAHMHCI